MSQLSGEAQRQEGEWAHRTEATGSLDQARGLDDGVDSSVQLHLAVHTAHRALLGRYDGHLNLPVVNQRVQDGFDVFHRQVNLW